MNKLKRITAKLKKIVKSRSDHDSYLLMNNDGFTWIELIVVMSMMAILSAMVVTSMMDDNTDLVAETQVFKAHLRYAQLRSINTDEVWYIKFTANSYSFFKFGDATAKLLPGEDNLTNTLPSGLNIDYSALDPDMVSFNTWVKPERSQLFHMLLAAKSHNLTSGLTFRPFSNLDNLPISS